MKILVTGGAGFIGHHLVSELVAGGHDTVVLDNLRRGSRAALAGAERHGSLRFIHGDVRNLETVRCAARGIQRVYHLAAQSNVRDAVSDLDYSFSTNVVGTFNVLSAALAQRVERVVFTSSREIYGEVDAIPVAEDHPMNPKNAYGAGKISGELYCRVFHNTCALDVNVLRLSNVYGSGDRGRVLPIWFDDALHGRDLVLYGGTQILDLVPVRLVVSALLRAGEKSLHGQAVNIGTGIGISLGDLAARVQALPHVHANLRIMPARPFEVTRFVADVTRMQALVGIAPPSDPLDDLSALWDGIRATLPQSPAWSMAAE